MAHPTARRTRLGKTNLDVPQIGLGTMQLGRDSRVKIPGGHKIPSIREAHALLDHALACGINLWDTAPAYGVSEERLGRFMGSKRSDIILVSKVGEEFDGSRSRYDFSPTSIKQSVNRSLSRLRTDYLDILLLHCPPGNDLHVLQDATIAATLEQLKRAGVVRFIGASPTTYAGAMDAAVSRYWDVLMLSYNAFDTHNAKAIQIAANNQKGVLIKKPLCSGRLTPLVERLRDSELEYVTAAHAISQSVAKYCAADLAQIAVRFVLSLEGVASAIIGMTRIAEVNANLLSAARGRLHATSLQHITSSLPDSMPSVLDR